MHNCHEDSRDIELPDILHSLTSMQGSSFIIGDLVLQVDNNPSSQHMHDASQNT